MPPRRKDRRATEDSDEDEAPLPPPAANRQTSQWSGAGCDDDSDGEAGADQSGEHCAFVDNMELLLEKKSATRVSALKTLVKLCQEHVFGDWLVDRSETLLAYVRKRLRGSSDEEVILAATLLAQAFIQVSRSARPCPRGVAAACASSRSHRNPPPRPSCRLTWAARPSRTSRAC